MIDDNASDVVLENRFFTDDAALIANMIKDEWSLGPEYMPNVTFVPEEMAVSARLGYIYVYRITRPNRITTVDYRTLGRESYVSVKLSTRLRKDMFAFGEELFRIFLANRRLGQDRMQGYIYMEIQSDKETRDLSGWYTVTIDLKLVTYNKAIRSAGFGDTINRQIDDLYNN